MKISFVISKIHKALTRLYVLPAAFKLVWNTTPYFTFLWIVTLVIKLLVPVAALFLTKLTVDSLVVAMSPHTTWTEARPVLVYVACAAVIWIFSMIGEMVSQYVIVAQQESVQDRVTSMLQEKSSSLDLAFFDRADYFDELFRAQLYGRHRPVSALHSFGDALRSLVTFIAVGIILIPYGLWLPLTLLFATIPTLYLLLEQKLLNYEFTKDTASDERKSDYVHWILTQRESAQELRLFNLAGTFMNQFNTVRTTLRNKKLKLTLRESFVKLAMTVCTLVATIGALGVMVFRASQGLISLGDLAFIYRAFTEGQNIIATLSVNVSELYTCVMVLGDLDDFLNIKPTLPVPQCPLEPVSKTPPQIQFSNVSFSYPSSERKVLSNFNLIIPGGKFSAIVGPNGMGKTTLLKLMCRFYDPDKGTVTFDDRNLKDMDARDIWKRISILFQEPVKYNATVKENILYGNVDLIEDNTLTDRIENAAKSAGAQTIVDKLSQGYDTVLGRIFCKGTDLSTGEWQRIALARAFMADNPILLLDEPTSAMDAWAEREWLNRFKDLSRGKTSVVITHRFSTAMYADKIFVVDKGRIIEEGSHEELMSSDTLYSSTLKPLLKSLAAEQMDKY